ncbi:mitochondrial carrier domain-containing protein [Lasiosphaeria ovina]|uniref:Mitochondrial carrier domain-containing protein n=1 Tax=Lasiosphaeria ovina TaxID=92902 RepID=A0AAE0JYD4_9PEZI|nr:mitochondrial carrier domain-containing protein [Lasiosphaeria ovina]
MTHRRPKRQRATMARDPDAEIQTPVSEETPLLSGGQASQQPADPNVNEAQADVEADPDTVVAVEEKETAWRHLWTVLWLVLAALVVALVVTGWTSGGDDIHFDLGQALWKALGGGLSGAAAMVLQVLLLMPLRTIMNYQYRFGGAFWGASRTLYQDGGYGRYYQGLGPALVQGPVSRFGDAAANVGILALLATNRHLSKLPLALQTVFVSLSVAGFRILLTPIDTLKTTLQAQGARGTALLRQRIKEHGLGSLYWGALATAAATFVGNYPWWATYNVLNDAWPEPPKHPLIVWLIRYAVIGFVASAISDSVSNSLRVVKTYRQVNDTKISYSEAATVIVRSEGISGLLGRGLQTRILCNGLQSLLFTILWRVFLDLWNSKTQQS